MLTYLDNAATTYPKPEVVYRAVDQANRELAYNAGRGSYAKAKEAADLIADTREQLKKLFHASCRAECIFTPSATIAFNEIIGGLDFASGDTIYVSSYEHNAVVRPLELRAKKEGLQVKLLPLKDDFTIDIAKTKYQFSATPPKAIIVSAISNVTGYILPVKEIFEEAAKYGAVNIIDAAQAAGLIDIDMVELKANIITFAGHKTLYGVFGAAGFILDGVNLNVVLAGGTGSDSLNTNMPKIIPGMFEPGSPNVVALAGLNTALKSINSKMHLERMTKLTEFLKNGLKDIPRIRIMGDYKEGEQLGIVSFVMDGYDSNDIGSILDTEYDISVRTGFHCAPYIHSVLKDVEYGGTVRVSLGLFNTEDDIKKLINAIRTL